MAIYEVNLPGFQFYFFNYLASMTLDKSLS